MVCVKNYLAHFVYHFDVSIGDQVWQQFSYIQDVLFGFCYIPPWDSHYYSNDLCYAI